MSVPLKLWLQLLKVIHEREPQKHQSVQDIEVKQQEIFML